jgi:hypothetical protein
MRRNTGLLYLLAFIKFILPFLLQAPLYEPHRDEFLYLAESHHMAWGYMEIPPLLSVFAWITNILGNSIFMVKLWPSLFGALTYVLVGRIILSLGGSRFALLLAFLPFVFGAYLRVHYLFQPNFLEIFFWTLIAYSLFNFIKTNKPKWLYVFGVSAGLGMLSKYSVAFFILAVIAGLLLTKHRKVFWNKHFYYASIIAVIIFLPNFIWQLNHHFPVVYHMKELQGTQLQYVSPTDFLMGQLLMNLPCVFIWFAGLWFVSFTQTGKQYRFVGWAYAAVIVLLIALHGKNYYSLGVYPVLFAFGSYYLEQLTISQLKWLRFAFVLIPVAVGTLFIPVALPVWAPQKLDKFYKATGMKNVGVLKWEDLKDHPLPQDFADMLGWEETAQKVAKAYSMLSDDEKKQTTIFCDNYGFAGAVDFYRKKYNLPVPYSDNASFLYWIPKNLKVVNIIVVTPDENEMQHPFVKDFKSAVVVDSVSNPFARERGGLIILFKGANENFNKFFQQQIAEEHAELGDGN